MELAQITAKGLLDFARNDAVDALHLRLRTAASTIPPVMMKLLRKHRDWLMIVIAILAIPFIFYFVRTPDYGQMHADKFARIYDRDVSMLEAQQTVRLLTLALVAVLDPMAVVLLLAAGIHTTRAGSR